MLFNYIILLNFSPSTLAEKPFEKNYSGDIDKAKFSEIIIQVCFWTYFVYLFVIFQCSESMYLFRGTGPPTELGTTRDIPTWFLCVLQCSTDVDCVLAWFSGYRKCTMYTYGSFNSMSRSEDPAIQPDTPNYITLKVSWTYGYIEALFWVCLISQVSL